MVIGTASYRVRAGDRERVHIRIAPRYRDAVRHHRLHGFRVRAV